VLAVCCRGFAFSRGSNSHRHGVECCAIQKITASVADDRCRILQGAGRGCAANMHGCRRSKTQHQQASLKPLALKLQPHLVAHRGLLQVTYRCSQAQQNLNCLRLPQLQTQTPKTNNQPTWAICRSPADAARHSRTSTVLGCLSPRSEPLNPSRRPPRPVAGHTLMQPGTAEPQLSLAASAPNQNP
jgi:hypothetical protein